MLRPILYGLSGFLVLFAGVVASWPSAVRLERHVVIDAPPEVAFQRVDGAGDWRAWAPWRGYGQPHIDDLEAPSRVSAWVDFADWWPGSVTATFWFTPDPAGTRVTWRMEADNDFLEKAAYLFLDSRTRESLAADMEQGLAALKELTERTRAGSVALLKCSDPPLKAAKGYPCNG